MFYMKNATMLTEIHFLSLSTYVDTMQQLKYWTSTYVDSIQLVLHFIVE